MIRKYAYYILPILILSSVILEQSGILHIGYLYIKSHELKWTNLDYNYYPSQGDIFTAGESVSNNNYEDAILSINADYKKILDQDLAEIANNREFIDSIDGSNLMFYTGDYMVKVCLDKNDIAINDSTLFKKLVNVEIIGQYELYDKDGCELLYRREGQKFWIRDKITLRGRSREDFILNKIKEIYIAQMSNNAHLIIHYFEHPYIYRESIKVLDGLQYLYYTSSNLDTTTVNNRSHAVYNEMNRIWRNGSRVYGHRDDPNYENKIKNHSLEIESKYSFRFVEAQEEVGI